MTPRDYAAMTDTELNFATATHCMHWGESRGDYWTSPSDLRLGKDWQPATNLNHAAELGAVFLARWPYHFTRSSVYASGAVAQIFESLGPEISRYEHASEARARTVATLTAWDALECEK